MDVELASDVGQKVEDVVSTLGLGHINHFRLICMRSKKSKANAYARIWNLPDIWQKALGVSTYYIIEVLSENYDPLPEDEKTKVIIHELLHVPKTFSGALMPHRHISGQIDKKTVEKIYKKYLEEKSKPKI